MKLIFTFHPLKALSEARSRSNHLGYQMGSLAIADGNISNLDP